MFSTGQYAYDGVAQRTVQIIERKELWGYVTYKVYDTVANHVYNISAESLREASTGREGSAAFVRFAAVWCRVRNGIAHGTLLQVSESVIPLPHQRYALERALTSNEVRYLLADEVGLGKTIEAGMIIKELKTRALIERVLVVCPKGLVTQWQVEMQEKFGETFMAIAPEDYDTLHKLHPDENIFAQFPLVISPMDAIKPLERRIGWDQERIDAHNNERIAAIVSGGWDLIIIDEAHHVAGSSSEVARHKLGDLLAKASPHLLLLTATPHSGKTEPFLRLMRLLDEQAFPNYRAVVKEQVAPFIIRTEKREAVDNLGNILFKNRITKIREIEWQARHSQQEVLYAAVTEYVRNGYNQALREKKQHIGFLMVLFQRLVTSSTAAIADALERRLVVLDAQSGALHNASISDFADVSMEESLEDALIVMSANMKAEVAELSTLLNVAKQAQSQFTDAKAESLLELLDTLELESGVKVILFTEFVATQTYLRDLLIKNGYLVSTLNGSMDIEQRNVALTEFRRKSSILVSTDAGGEGLNLQFANIVVNFDLPWNPMKLEQRIGRADRIGQTRDVLVFNFVLEDTVENRVRKVLEDKLAVIFAELGIDKLQDVLDNESSDINFTEAYMQTIAHPKVASHYVNVLTDDIAAQVKQAERVKDLIRDDKTLEPNAASDVQQQVFHQLLREVLYNYRAWQGEETQDPLETELTLNDPTIHYLLERDEVWNIKDGASVVAIENLPTEHGLWSLWEVALSPEPQDRRIVSIFINHDGVFRPTASRLIWDEVVSGNKRVNVQRVENVPDEEFQLLADRAQEVAADTFLTMKQQFHSRHEQQYHKRTYAMDLRIEAAERIGIENIRKARVQKLLLERDQIVRDYQQRQAICPTFRPMLLAIME